MYSLKSSLFALTLGASVCSCSFDGSNGGDIDGGASRIDATNTDTDADIDASGSDEPHLLLSEVKNTPGGKEFIEIYNPGNSEVSLDSYYIADTGDYLNLAALSIAPAPPSHPNDFIVRFPPGNTIPAMGVIVVGVGLRPSGAMNTVISAEYHIDPFDGFPGQEMLEASPGSVRSSPTLTNQGEGVVLFQWDGISNLVSDVDIVIAGDNPSKDNSPPNKTDISVTLPSGTDTYADDMATLPKMSNSLSGDESYQRIALEGLHETQNGVGNGITGDDETSEDTSMTWTIADMSPGTVSISN